MRPFTDVLGELSGGATLERLSTDLAEIVTAVRETGKVGKLTLKIDVKPNGVHGIELRDAIEAKIPQEERGGTLFFHDEEGGLHRRDPRQHEMPLRQVAADHDPQTGEVR